MSSKPTRRPRPDLPIAASAARLADLARRIEDGAPLTPVFVETFAMAKADHQVAVTQATTDADMLLFLTNGAKGARDRWAAKAKAFEAAHKELKDAALAAIEADPDLPWTDAYGQRVYVANNSAPSLNITLSLGDKTVANIVSEDDMEKLELGPWVKQVSFLVIDTDRVRQALAGGLTIPWATLQRGRHVRGLSGHESPE